MVGIREKKKKLAREKILKISKELFLSQGYDATTTDQIAEKAELGVGTIYNYYKTKADIFIATLVDEFGIDEDYNIESIDLSGHEVADIVYEYIRKYTKNLRYFGKKMMRELIAAALSSFKSKPEFFRKLMKLDYKFMEDILELLNFLKEKEVLEKDYNTQEATELIYSAMIFEFSIYVYKDEVSLEETMERVKKKIEFIFK